MKDYNKAVTVCHGAERCLAGGPYGGNNLVLLKVRDLEEVHLEVALILTSELSGEVFELFPSIHHRA